jgi:ATP diphosphatase
MAEERHAFAFDDVVDAIATKMIRRHPHVFGSPEQRAAGAAPGFWERAKQAEKGAKGAPASVLDDVPASLPALTRAVKLQNKAAKVGFDWPSLAPVLAKLEEELAELATAIGKDGAGPGASNAGATDAVAEELGDLLFVIANVARHLELDPEGALRAANEKFIRRFRYIEARLAKDGRTPGDSDLAEMDALWDEAKTKDL